MSVNSSSFKYLALLSSYPLSLNQSLNVHTNRCFRLEISTLVFSAFSITSFLLLPFFILVLYLGYRQWRQQRSVSTVTHSDLFIYHSIAMQLITFLGSNCCFCGGYIDLRELMMGGLYICSITAIGQTQFQILTCVERYLAVVHPITYLNLRQVDEVRIRNITIGCVWLLSFGWLVMCWVTVYELYLVLYGCGTAFALVVVSFCSISVLCALKRPGPGRVGGNKVRVDQSKKRAFHTIMVVLGVLSIRLMGNLTVNLLYKLNVVDPDNYCLALLCVSWVDLPSGLVLPLLFLKRMGKLQCCKQNIQSG